MMITYADALEILEKIAATRTMPTESVGLSQAIGRILSSFVQSEEESPSFTNSAMDGFAVFSSDTAGASPSNPKQIPVRGAIVFAGDIQTFEAAKAEDAGTAVEIMTGAPLPGQYDAVIRVEDVTIKGTFGREARAIEIRRSYKPGENIRLRGSDFSTGQAVLYAGTRVGPEHVLACSTLGITQLPVRALPRVAIVSTGAELVAPGERELKPGMIRNSTAPYLLAMLRGLGIEARQLGIVRDDPAQFRKVLGRALSDGVDIVISTGAVSMGKLDFVAEVLKEMGAETHFHKAAIRPGKPILFAELESGGSQEKCAYFGLPGNPVSTAVGLRFFLEPYIRALLGLPREAPVAAKLARDTKMPEGLRCFFKGRASATPDGVEVEALKGQASYVVSALLESNCWVVLREGGPMAVAGTQVDIFPLHNAFERGVLS